MAIEVPRSLVEFILLGPEDDRRQLQDSPILGDVWIEFARRPGKRLELLITPYREQAAGTVAAALATVDDGTARRTDVLGEANIAFLQGIVAARLTFEEVLRYVVPMTSWWGDKRIADSIRKYVERPETMDADIGAILVAADRWFRQRDMEQSDAAMQDLETRKRYIALAGLVLWAQQQDREHPEPVQATTTEQLERILGRDIAAPVADGLKAVFASLAPTPADPLVWTISLNRRATPAITKSVPAVKADAARTLFTVDCTEIVWAVIDSGIDAGHLAFRDKDGRTRVRRSFDFTRIRDIVSLDNLRDSDRRKKRIDQLLKSKLKRPVDRKSAAARLQQLAEGAREGRSINWALVEELVEIDGAKVDPPSNHGTHVAGIIGASRTAGKPSVRDGDAGDRAEGMCPDIGLYDFRVLAPTLRETEFAIIAALQYIRYVNERNSYITIQGANLSLSIPHDVRNYACGRTPVCNECERLVNSGVVVVAAAGNRGYQNFETKEGIYESYAAFSVTDPGNADGVITVGATHRSWPHTYGVSFFSSRGPTGDGRIKPDLVAPGERIRAPLPKQQWGDLDGTSMAAPHVSGAAAMLMARYSELIGQPRRIKDVLCRSATDLGREKTFQGHGMLDVLRAFQSI